MAPIPRVDFWLVNVVICSVSSLRTSSGRAPARLLTWVAICAGSATNPYIETRAINAGKMARKPKNATPAASNGTWSAFASAIPRLRIWNQPLAGMSLGCSASPPGTPWASRPA